MSKSIGPIGFSTGGLFKLFSPKRSLALLKEIGCRAAEVTFIKETRSTGIEAGDLDAFEYVSIHAPSVTLKQDTTTEKILKEIERVNNLRKIDLVVFHPDCVPDPSLLSKMKSPVALENMDSTKKSFQTPTEFEAVLNKYPQFTLVMDLNHIYTNDPTMKLADEFHSRFGEKISEYHLSGFKKLHEPLFQTKQPNIIRAVQRTNLPIILEGTVSPNELKLEYDYVLKNLTK